MSQRRDTIAGMDGMTESTSPPPSSKLDQWIAGLTNTARLEAAWAKLLDIQKAAPRHGKSGITAAQVEAAAHELNDAWRGLATRRRTAARLQAQSEAQRQDRVMAEWMGMGEWPGSLWSDDRIYGLRYRRPWLNKELVKI